MSSDCVRRDVIAKAVVSSVMHMTILFIILALFFRFYASGIIKSTMEHELEEVIHQHMSTPLEGPNKIRIPEMENKNELIRRLINLYSGPSKAIQTNNDWLFRDIFTVATLLAILLVVTIAMSKLLCGTSNVGHLFLKNGLVFTGVGLVEFIFFKLVVSQYIPLPPSTMGKTIIESLKKSL